MAKKHRKSGSAESILGAKSYRLCAPGDSTCQGALLPPVNIHIRPGFNYTTGTAIPPRTAAERRTHGCEESSKGSFTGRLKNGKPDGFCKAFSAPCGDPKAPRAGCPVQLVFTRGQPNLRFCDKPGQPGYLVPVSSPEEAERLAKKACANWPNKPKARVEWPTNFFQKNAPDIIEAARQAHPKGSWGAPGLGGPIYDEEPEMTVHRNDSKSSITEQKANSKIGFAIGSAIAAGLGYFLLKKTA